MDYITDTIDSFTPDQFLGLIENIYLATFTLNAWNSNSPNKQLYNNIEFQIICYML